VVAIPLQQRGEHTELWEGSRPLDRVNAGRLLLTTQLPPPEYNV
jgi:hypothetical protein